ncbi:hypothetical protein, partial [Escherichia coli]|uniref:hypothetical protein n=1 Tax=Escherichia coli TaxID=562 RepID=UPI001AD8E4E6
MSWILLQVAGTFTLSVFTPASYTHLTLATTYYSDPSTVPPSLTSETSARTQSCSTSTSSTVHVP